MELLKKIFVDDDMVIGLCPFKTNFVPRKEYFYQTEPLAGDKIVYNANIARNPNIFAFAK